MSGEEHLLDCNPCDWLASIYQHQNCDNSDKKRDQKACLKSWKWNIEQITEHELTQQPKNHSHQDAKTA